jgi:Family of unknown function (DUF5681)
VAENTAGKQRGKPFKPRKSGNPAGKPKGSRNAATRAMEALLDGESGALTRKALELAKGGDLQALRLSLDRILSPRKDRPIEFAMPVITSVKDAPRAMASPSRLLKPRLPPPRLPMCPHLVETYVRSV